jgi:hypothetical protein
MEMSTFELVLNPDSNPTAHKSTTQAGQQITTRRQASVNPKF